ncbi:TetR/AcrR family transcriptional regulator [Stella sp.]|uniref:TetR/AcrR family transcriptional regulator n=1 Tax=Stella sp. TaxID=2912054 RepID=UPI0035B1892D
MALLHRPRASADETRSRILEKSEELFRRLGFAKTAVADIAAELGMSPANVYRFFASKNALVEAICQQHLAHIHAELTQIAFAKAPVADRLERFVLSIIRYHKANFLNERRLHDIVLVAMEHSWDSIEEHKRALAGLIEAVVRSGIETGEVGDVDPQQTARVVFGCFTRFCHPLIIQQHVDDDLEGEAQATVRFLCRALR